MDISNNKIELSEWLIPATQKPWIPGTFGMCSKCGHINNGHTKKIPNFCEKCGRKIKNGNL